MRRGVAGRSARGNGRAGDYHAHVIASHDDIPGDNNGRGSVIVALAEVSPGRWPGRIALRRHFGGTPGGSTARRPGQGGLQFGGSPAALWGGYHHTMPLPGDRSEYYRDRYREKARKRDQDRPPLICAREGCSNLFSQFAGRKYCGELECNRIRNRIRDRDRERDRKPYGKKRGKCSSCGSAVWLGKGSRPDPVCRACRSAANGLMPKPRGTGGSRGPWVCEQCGTEFQRYVSKNRPDPRFCTVRCWADKQRTGRNKTDARRRRAVVASTWDGVTDQQVFERDGWQCMIPGCTQVWIPRNPARPWPDPLSPSIDHIVPLSLGGTDTAPNKRAAHLLCNTRRGATMHPEDIQIVTPELAPLGVLPGKKLPKPVNHCLTCENEVKRAGASCSECKTEAMAERRRRILACREQGMTWADVAIEVGLSGPGAAYNAVSNPQVVLLDRATGESIPRFRWTTVRPVPHRPGRSPVAARQFR